MVSENPWRCLVVVTAIVVALFDAQPAAAAQIDSSDAVMSASNELQAAADGVEQALLRFAAGQDLDDLELLGAAFSEDAVLDFAQPATQLGASVGAMHGRKQIVEVITAVTAPLITTHTISNVRITHLSDSQAHAHALIEAMHIDRKNPNRRLLLKNSLDIAAVRIGHQWQIRSLKFQNMWREGEPAVLFPDATPSKVQAAADQGPLSVIIYQPGPAWKKGRPLSEQDLESHGRYLAELTRAGTILSAGPLAGTEGGLVIVSGPVAKAQKIMNADPAHVAGKFTGVISQWTPMMGWMSRKRETAVNPRLATEVPPQQ